MKGSFLLQKEMEKVVGAELKINLPLTERVSCGPDVNAVRIGDEVFTREEIESSVINVNEKIGKYLPDNSVGRNWAITVFLWTAPSLSAFDRMKEKITKARLRTEKPGVRKILNTPDQVIFLTVVGKCIYIDPSNS